VDTSQNVGIGTASPANRLHVFSTTNAVQLKIEGDGSTVRAQINTVNDHGDCLWGIEGGTTTGDGIIYIAGATNLKISTNGTERMRIPSAGGVQAVTCVSVGNATPSVSGAGITFPASQSASSDANTLDDYEEGSWNATVSDGTNNATMSTNGGSYTKVGNLVTVTGYFACSNKASISGNLRVIGLPFTVFNGTAAYAGQAFGYTGGANITGGQNTIGVYAEYNTTYLNLTFWNASTGTSGLPATAINNNFDFILSLTYRTN
jgi:hypothetical protein